MQNSESLKCRLLANIRDRERYIELYNENGHVIMFDLIAECREEGLVDGVFNYASDFITPVDVKLTKKGMLFLKMCVTQ